MTCKRYRDGLSGVAAGAAAPFELEAHLASCAACRAELAALRHALAVADDEMARLALAEPSPDLVARIRRAAAKSPEPAPAWRLGWGFMLTAAAAAVIAAAAFLAQRVPPTGSPATVAERAPAHDGPRATPVPEPVSPDTRPRQPEESRPRPSAPSRDEQAREPAVLVQREEAEALVRFAASLRHRGVTPESLLVADLSAPLAEPQVGEIRPIEIVPLDAAEGGGANE